MFEPFPLGLGGGRRSDRHGVTERHTTLALSRPFLDPRDIAADGAVACWRSRRTRLERSQCGPCGARWLSRGLLQTPLDKIELRIISTINVLLSLAHHC